MNSKQIDSVLEVARTKNFTKAAENLFVTQPALTYTIKTLEDEVGFKIFERSGKGAVITVAGEYFIKQLREMKTQLINCIEYSRNLSYQYSDLLTLCLPTRSSLYYLPEIVEEFKKEYPDIRLNITYIYGDRRIDGLLNGTCDILFVSDSQFKKIPNTYSSQIYQSRIYLVTPKGHPLEKKEKIDEQDLEGHTLLSSEHSPNALRNLQLSLQKNKNIQFLNSPDHDTSLTYISLKWALNLIPGFLNDYNPAFSWIPYDTLDTISCDLVKRADDDRQFIRRFIEISKEVYLRHSHENL